MYPLGRIIFAWSSLLLAGRGNTEVCFLEIIKALAFFNYLRGLYPRPFTSLNHASLHSTHPSSICLAVLSHHCSLLDLRHLHRTLPGSHDPLHLILMSHHLAITALDSILILPVYSSTAAMRVLTINPIIISVEGGETRI